MSAIADNLIHFLGRESKDSPNKQLEVFKSIISRGLRCGKIQIKFGDSGAVHNQVVCFTDIPLSLCEEHTAIYGKFGIGFKKSFIKKCGGNPARYFINYFPGETRDESLLENRGILYTNLCSEFRVLKLLSDALNADSSFTLYDQKGTEIFSHDKLKEYVNQQIATFSFEKESGDLGPTRDETRETDLYYKEREWRLVPFQANVLSGSVTFDTSDGLGYYKFRRKDVNMVVTPNDEIRKDVLMFLLGLGNEADPRLKEFSESPLPVVTYDDLNKW